jgi:Na+/pantothenate symporter
MKDLKENKLFYRSLLVCYAVIAICTLEIFPPLNELLQLAPLPSITAEMPTTTTEAGADPAAAATFDNIIPVVAQRLLSAITFSVFLVALMVADTLLVFAFERTIRRTFEQRSD